VIVARAITSAVAITKAAVGKREVQFLVWRGR
jgi:hypothetical protein